MNKLEIIKLQVVFYRKFYEITNQPIMFNMYVKYLDIRIEMINMNENGSLYHFLQNLQHKLTKQNNSSKSNILSNLNNGFQLDFSTLNFNNAETLDFFYDFISFDNVSFFNNK